MFAIENIRRNPAEFFCFNDKRGVENGFRSMLTFFSEEATKNHIYEIKVFYYGDGSVEIGFDCASFLCADYISEINKNRSEFDRAYNFSILECNMYVSSFMEFSNEYKGVIKFERGVVTKSLSESECKRKGTYIRFKYDNEVFTDIELSKEFLISCLDEFAMLNNGTKYVFFCKTDSRDYDEQIFFYKERVDYIKKISGLNGYNYSYNFSYHKEGGTEAFIYCEDDEISADGRDAKINVAFSWNDEPTATKIDCYLNHRKVDDPKTIVDAFFSGLRYCMEDACAAMYWNKYNNSLKRVYIPVREIKKHINIVFDIRTKGFDPLCLENQFRYGIDSELLINLVDNISGIFEFVGESLGKIYSWWSNSDLYDNDYCSCNSFSELLENAVIDCENGDGNGDLIYSLSIAPETEEVYSQLVNLINRKVCNSEAMYYYIIFSKFAKYITKDNYDVFVSAYEANISKLLPSFFEVDERFERICNIT